jgi:hypothetical protein
MPNETATDLMCAWLSAWTDAITSWARITSRSRHFHRPAGLVTPWWEKN